MPREGSILAAERCGRTGRVGGARVGVPVLWRGWWSLSLDLAGYSFLSLSRPSECPAERARGLEGKPPPMFLPVGRPGRAELIVILWCGI